jgi:hypothetical protein
VAETIWRDDAKAAVDRLVREAGSEHRGELIALLRSSLHTLNAREGDAERKIIRLTDVPKVNGKYLYRCEGCGEEDRGKDNDRNHMQWRERHVANCWP